MVSTLFRDPQARSSALAALGMLQPQVFGSLNRVETLDSVSNYYLLCGHNRLNLTVTTVYLLAAVTFMFLEELMANQFAIQ